MDTTNEQRQVATAIEELESRLNRLNPRLAQVVEELTDVHAQVHSALTDLDDLRDAHRRLGYAIEAVGHGEG